jgi:lactate permease
MLLVAGGSFAGAQFFSSNYLDYSLTDVFASMGSLIITLLFLKVWSPAHDPEFAIREEALNQVAGTSQVTPWKGWLPWIVVTATVIVWTNYKVSAIGQQKIAWPGLNKAISITLYHDKPYEAIWAFQPLATGTAILVACILTTLLVGMSPIEFVRCAIRTARQTWMAIMTVMFVMGLAYLMNYSGLAYSLGAGVAATGAFFVFLSPFLGWIAVMLSGSDSSGNALFGNLQVVAAKQLNLNPVLFAAANSSGGVMGKMISPQNITTGVSVVGMAGQEGKVFARTFVHSFILTAILSVLIVLQQYVLTWMIPVLPAVH